jgi:hypothetical protein
MDQYNDDTLIVLTEETARKRYEILDFSIDIGKQIWFVINR